MSKKATNQIDKEIGARVRLRRVQIGMSQEKLGEALGLTFQQIQKYEKGMNRISVSRLDQIAYALSTGIDYFLPNTASQGKSATFMPMDKDSLDLLDLFDQIQSKTMRRAIIFLTRAAVDQQQGT